MHVANNVFIYSSLRAADEGAMRIAQHFMWEGPRRLKMAWPTARLALQEVR